MLYGPVARLSSAAKQVLRKALQRLLQLPLCRGCARRGVASILLCFQDPQTCRK